MLDVLMLTYYDFSNTGHRFARMLDSLGLGVKMLKGRAHEYNYPEQAEVFGPLAQNKPLHKFPIIAHCPELAPFVEGARVVHFTSSTFISTGVDLSDKHVVVNHGGSTYRHGTEQVRRLFNQFVDASIIQCPDLLGLGAKNEVLIYYPVDTEFLQPDFEKKGEKLVVGHFPSSPLSKGTSDIIKLMRRFEGEIEYVGVTDAIKRQVDWLDHLERIRRCDVIIETICPVQRGRKFGEFGNQCFESAALGKAVITNNLAEDVYLQEYGEKPAIFKANCIEEAEVQLRRLIAMSDLELLEAKKRSRAWVESRHAMAVTAERLWEKVYRHLI